MAKRRGRRGAARASWRLAALAAGLACLAYLSWLPDPAPLKTRPPRTTAYMELRREEAADKGRKLAIAWSWVPYEDIAVPLREAVLMSEDGTFWRHGGLDWEAIQEAWRLNLAKRRFAYGASTITQQLARNLYLSPSKNPLRKLKEALIARRLEKVLGKKRILELYLNVAEWGPGVFGCEAAARHYYGKSAADLSYEEAAALAAVLPNPRKWSPVKRSKRVQRRVERILARLKSVGKLPPAPLETPEEVLEPEEVAVSTEAGAGPSAYPGSAATPTAVSTTTAVEPSTAGVDNPRP